MSGASTDTGQALIENVRWLLDSGEAPERIARRVGYSSPANLARRMITLGRSDLASRLNHKGGWTP